MVMNVQRSTCICQRQLNTWHETNASLGEKPKQQKRDCILSIGKPGNTYTTFMFADGDGHCRRPVTQPVRAGAFWPNKVGAELESGGSIGGAVNFTSDVTSIFGDSFPDISSGTPVCSAVKDRSLVLSSSENWYRIRMVRSRFDVWFGHGSMYGSVTVRTLLTVADRTFRSNSKSL